MKIITHRLPLIILILFSYGTFQAEDSLEVDRKMLLWKKGLDYRTEVKAKLALTHTKIRAEIKDGNETRQAEGTVNRAFHYSGAMVYSTEVVRDTTYNGSASRLYQECDINKGETDPAVMTVDASLWEVWKSRLAGFTTGGLPEEYRDKFEVVERNAEMFGKSSITVRPKSGTLFDQDALELAFESLNALKDKYYLLEWDRLKSIEKAKLKVFSAQPTLDGQLNKTEGSVASVVTDVIRREAKLLYEAMMGSIRTRRDGDVWLVEGRDLEALIHPQLEGLFQGRVLVKAEAIRGLSPERSRTVGEMNGFKLKFIPRGMVEGRIYQSTLSFDVKTTDDSTHRTDFEIAPGKFEGEIWLDTDNQTVRYGRVVATRTRYDGYLPKIGKLNAKIDLEADLDFDFEYSLGIAASARE